MSWNARPRGATILVVALSLAWPSEPMVVLSPNELKFAAQAQGTTSTPQKILLRNIGNAELIINSITISGENGAEFVETHTCPAAPVPLNAGGNCEIQIVFKPVSSGDLSATLNVSDNASGSPQTLLISGHSGSPSPAVTLSSGTLAFGNQPVGTSSKVQMVVLRNSGSATLNINSPIRITGPASGEFHLQKSNTACPEDTGQLAPNASCSIGVVFAPVAAGPKSAQVIIEDDAANSPQAIALSGTGSGT